jgi:5-methylcytosine-specific restriction endonuclease McrA
MSSLARIVAAHPLQDFTPYNAIKFARVDGNGTPLYTVGRETKEMGAAAALRSAAQKFGGHCFYCDKFMRPEEVPKVCTNDHLQPRAKGGHDYLHNLVFACVRCNRDKGAQDLISYRPNEGRDYLNALDAHLVRCLRKLGSN